MWYRIDAVDRVCAVSNDWEEAARQNGAPGLLAATVLGRPIWSFIDGEAVCFHYARIFETVRQTQRASQLRMRADGPFRQSLLEIDVAPDAGQCLTVTVETLRERATAHTPLWDRSLPRGSTVSVACSWCKAIRVDHTWLRQVDAAAVVPEFRSLVPPEVLHDVCPSCDQRVSQMMHAALAH